MQCFYREFPKKGKFVFQHETGGERPDVAPKAQPDGSHVSPEGRAAKMISSALGMCDALSCKVDIQEKPWQEESKQILDKIQNDPGLRLAFNTFLKEYARAFGEQSFDTTENVTDNFYAALSISGVPDSAVGFNTAWNDVLHIAEKGVAQSAAKWPYERLKTVIDSARIKPGTQIAQK